MRAGMIGFILGIVLMFLALVTFQHVVIKAAADDLDYHFINYVFHDSKFPWGYVDQGRVVTRCLFPVKVTVSFYDAQYHEVTQADTPGRYGAVVRMSLNGGVVTQRFITLYRTPAKVFFSEVPVTVSAQLPAGTGIDPAVLHTQEQEIGGAVRYGFCGDNGASSDLAILLAGLSETSPQDPPAVGRNDVLARDADWWFGLRQRLGLAEKYPYLVDLPYGYDANPGRRWPLILYLHSGNEKGNNLQLVRQSGLAGAIARGKQLPAIVISPQCVWYEDWDIRVLSQLLDEISIKYRVDPDRIYLTGASTGGDATWALGLAYPERFAALVPIAGGGDPTDAARIKDIPTWAFHGLKDDIVSPGATINMIAAMRQAGGHPHMTLFTQTGHDSWDQAYATNALYPWLLAQKRGQPEMVTPGVPTLFYRR
jgi:pimeloyl-ACP methyl ester carboxylesterase